MAVIIRYRAVHEETGEVLEGEAEMLAEEIGIPRSRFYHAACYARPAKGWHVEKIESKTLAERWDAATAPFKALSRELRESKA